MTDHRQYQLWRDPSASSQDYDHTRRPSSSTRRDSLEPPSPRRIEAERRDALRRLEGLPPLGASSHSSRPDRKVRNKPTHLTVYVAKPGEGDPKPGRVQYDDGGWNLKKAAISNMIVHPMYGDPKNPRVAQCCRAIGESVPYDTSVPFSVAPPGWTILAYNGSAYQHWDKFYDYWDYYFLTHDGKLKSSKKMGYYNPEKPKSQEEVAYWDHYAEEDWDCWPKFRLAVDTNGQLQRVVRLGKPLNALEKLFS